MKLATLEVNFLLKSQPQTPAFLMYLNKGEEPGSGDDVCIGFPLFFDEVGQVLGVVAQICVHQHHEVSTRHFQTVNIRTPYYISKLYPNPVSQPCSVSLSSQRTLTTTFSRFPLYRQGYCLPRLSLRNPGYSSKPFQISGIRSQANSHVHCMLAILQNILS